jgi:hypothetical protein
VKVSELATGRAGDKGPVLDLTLVTRDAEGYELLARELTEPVVERALELGPVRRYEVPGLNALKYVLPEALGAGVYATPRAGIHWQKAAIRVLLDLDVSSPGERSPE